MMCDDVMKGIQDDLNKMKSVFLDHRYNDLTSGWIVEDLIYNIQDRLNDYFNKDFKYSEPDPFN